MSGKARLRSLAAFDRLLGSLIDIPASKLESISNRVRAKSRQEVQLIEAEAAVARDTLENDKEVSRLVGENYIQREMGLAANKASVVRQSIEYLADAESNDSESGDQTSQDTRLDDDWLNYFEKYAEQASSERMRDLWARVLAGEIRKPQSFSLVTLRFLSELDRDIASLFEDETTCRMTEGFILKPKNDELVGKKLLNLSFLEEVGLLQDVGTGLNLPVKAGEDGILRWREGDFVLSAGVKGEANLSIIRITRVGREVVNILPPPNYIEVLERIEQNIRSIVEWSQIDQIVRESEGGMAMLRLAKVLKKKETD